MQLNELRKLAGLPLVEADSGLAEKVYTMLMSQSFADWYEEEFQDHVEGAEGAQDKAAVLAKIAQMLG